MEVKKSFKCFCGPQEGLDKTGEHGVIINVILEVGWETPRGKKNEGRRKRINLISTLLWPLAY